MDDVVEVLVDSGKVSEGSGEGDGEVEGDEYEDISPIPFVTVEEVREEEKEEKEGELPSLS